MKIVVVESDRELLAFVHLVLLAGGHDVRVFLSGAPAVLALQEGTTDLLLCDLGLPDMEGELVARAAALVPNPPSIVLMSGEPARLDRARPLGNAVLEKPFQARELLAVLDRMPPRIP
jgi:DNA-binding response OmpR family regulator